MVVAAAQLLRCTLESEASQEVLSMERTLSLAEKMQVVDAASPTSCQVSVCGGDIAWRRCCCGRIGMRFKDCSMASRSSRPLNRPVRARRVPNAPPDGVLWPALPFLSTGHPLSTRCAAGKQPRRLACRVWVSTDAMLVRCRKRTPSICGLTQQLH